MYIIVLGIFIIKLQISVSEPEFPPHLDLQKVGETIFNNEKYNILKPTTHVITDHFKDFMLRRDISKHPAKRVFIDKNGFRHYWSSIGEKTNSLRKTDLKYLSASFEKASDNVFKLKKISKDGNVNIIPVVEDTKVPNNKYSDNENDEANEHSGTVQKQNISNTEIAIENFLRTDKNSTNATKKDESVNNKAAKKADDGKKTEGGKKKEDVKKTENDKKIDGGKKADGGNKSTAKKDNKAKKDDTKTDSGDKAKTDNKAKNNKAKPDNKKKKERTVAKTTFFCPFFGVITMSAFID